MLNDVDRCWPLTSSDGFERVLDTSSTQWHRWFLNVFNGFEMFWMVLDHFWLKKVFIYLRKVDPRLRCDLSFSHTDTNGLRRWTRFDRRVLDSGSSQKRLAINGECRLGCKRNVTCWADDALHHLEPSKSKEVSIELVLSPTRQVLCRVHWQFCPS